MQNAALDVVPSPPRVEDQRPGVQYARSAVSRIFISPSGESSYHGLTSTLFDDAPMDRHGQTRAAGPQVPVEDIQKRLMGEAAYQRMSPIFYLQYTESSSPYPRPIGENEHAGRQAGL